MLQGLKALYFSRQYINVGDLRLPLFLRGDECYTGRQRGATTIYIVHTTLHSLFHAALKKGVVLMNRQRICHATLHDVNNTLNH